MEAATKMYSDYELIKPHLNELINCLALNVKRDLKMQVFQRHDVFKCLAPSSEKAKTPKIYASH